MKNRPETYSTRAGEQNAEKKKNDAGRFLELIEKCASRTPQKMDSNI